MPANQSCTVIACEIHIILDPACLHDAFTIEMIPLIVDLLPGIHNCFAALGKIIPVSLICSAVDAGSQLQPLVVDHNTIRIHVILLFYPAVNCHLSVTVKITPLIIGTLFPLIGHMTAAGIIINPFSILRYPSCRCHSCHTTTCRKSKG